MSSFSIIIAGRSIKLSRTYVGLAIFFAGLAIFVTNLPVQAASSQTSTPGVDPQVFFRYLALPFLTLPPLTLTTPVMLVYVYDKNNGVLEYLLSLGKNQSDVFMSYLKAALFLATVMYGAEIVVYVTTGLVVGVDLGSLILVSGLVLALSLSAVCVVSVAMMAFSSLQKQRVGANQPLGTGLGVFLVMPSIFISLISIFWELVYSIAVIIGGLVVLVLASRLISREKLLP